MKIASKMYRLYRKIIPGRVAQSVTCLATDASLTADPGVASSIPARSHTFVEICLFDFILYVHSTIFQLCGTVLPGLNQY